ncbi:MAG: hypothetical protein JRJ26_06275 [Deltaproteobacteria bacterium]|nr:hypothetical protein [Deltaproteobacteria bacterium]
MQGTFQDARSAETRRAGKRGARGPGSTRGGPPGESTTGLVQKETRAALALRGKERLEMIIRSSDPAAVVRSLPESEVFFTIKEVGEQDAVELIKLTTPGQLTYILDLELWSKDQIDRDKGALWLEILETCGEAKIAEFLKTADPELLVSLFGKLIRVIKTETREEEPHGPGGQSLLTFDRVYYLEFLDKGAEVPLTRILDFLCSHDLVFYQSLMESILWDIPAETEALALRWRNGRLADRGFPDFEQALEIYSYIDPERVRQERFEALPPPNQSFYPPVQIQLAGKQGWFFSLALQEGLDQTSLERVQWEIMALANRVLVADAADPADLGAVHRSVRKAFQTLDLGLRYLSHEDRQEALRVLKTVPVVRIFQTGFSLALRLRRKADHIVRKGWLRAITRGIEVLDSPLRETMKGLLRKRPLFYSEQEGGNLRPFERLEELALVEERLRRVAALGRIVHEYMGIPADAINRLDPASCWPHSPTLSTICLTVLANRVLHGKNTMDPLERDSLGRVHELFVGRIRGRPRGGLRPAIRQILLDQSIKGGRGLSGDQEEELHWWVDVLAGKLESSMGRIRPGGEIDPRFIDAMVVRVESSSSRIFRQRASPL